MRILRRSLACVVLTPMALVAQAVDRPSPDSVHAPAHHQAYVPVRVDSGQLPRYPALLSTARVGGRVRLEVLIDSTGRVQPAMLRIQQSSHDLFTVAVKRVVPGWHFTPARVGGRAVSIIMPLEFDFMAPRSDALAMASSLFDVSDSAAGVLATPPGAADGALHWTIESPWSSSNPATATALSSRDSLEIRGAVTRYLIQDPRAIAAERASAGDSLVVSIDSLIPLRNDAVLVSVQTSQSSSGTSRTCGAQRVSTFWRVRCVIVRSRVSSSSVTVPKP